MSTKTLLLGFAVLGVLALPVCAYADGEATTTSTKGSASGKASVSPSDEDFLAQMSAEDFPGTADMSAATDSLSAEMAQYKDSFGAAPADTAPAEKIKYIYKGESETTLRRSIQDDRIDDGYVQGLMRQRGPQ